MTADVSHPKESTEGGAMHFSPIVVIMCAYVCNNPGTLMSICSFYLSRYPSRGQRGGLGKRARRGDISPVLGPSPVIDLMT